MHKDLIFMRQKFSPRIEGVRVERGRESSWRMEKCGSKNLKM